MSDTPRELTGATILFINNYSGVGLGGGEVHMRALVRAVLEASGTPVVACHPGSDVEREFAGMGVATEPLLLTARSLPTSARRVRALVESCGADLVHSNGWLTNAVARIACGRSSVPVVNTVHVDPDAPALTGASRIEVAIRNTVDRATYGWADVISPVTQVVAEKLTERGAPSDRVRVIPGSVDASKLRADAATGHAGFVRRDDASYVGMVGRLEHVKGIDTFVRAAAEIVQGEVGGSSHPRFVIGGAGPLEGDLRATATALSVAHRIEFLGKVECTAAVFALLDVVVVPSLSEGFGIVAAEAMALGKPVVASNTGGLAEVVEDGVTGVLVPPGDVSALAGAIAELLEDPSRAATLGEAGRRRVEKHYDAEHMTGAYLDLYAELLGMRETTLPSPGAQDSREVSP